ncbi:MAG: hypothetical protein AAB592_00480 [Patescibacteria group bacterium]
MKNNLVKYYITLNNKRYFYTMRSSKGNNIFFECESAGISQEFLNEDIPALLIDLPNLILAEKRYRKEQDYVIRFRVNAEDKKMIEEKALKNGYKSISGFLRSLAHQA